MNQKTRIWITCALSLMVGMVQADSDLVASVAGVSAKLVADGSIVSNGVLIGIAPTEKDAAVVTVDGETTLEANISEEQIWNAAVPGNHALVQTVGDVTLAANYVVAGQEEEEVVVASAVVDLMIDRKSVV